jgi:hypothetical protein
MLSIMYTCTMAIVYFNQNSFVYFFFQKYRSLPMSQYLVRCDAFIDSPKYLTTPTHALSRFTSYPSRAETGIKCVFYV